MSLSSVRKAESPQSAAAPLCRPAQRSHESKLRNRRSTWHYRGWWFIQTQTAETVLRPDGSPTFPSRYVSPTPVSHLVPQRTAQLPPPLLPKHRDTQEWWRKIQLSTWPRTHDSSEQLCALGLFWKPCEFWTTSCEQNVRVLDDFFSPPLLWTYKRAISFWHPAFTRCSIFNRVRVRSFEHNET